MLVEKYIEITGPYKDVVSDMDRVFQYLNAGFPYIEIGGTRVSLSVHGGNGISFPGVTEENRNQKVTITVQYYNEEIHSNG